MTKTLSILYLAVHILWLQNVNVIVCGQSASATTQQSVGVKTSEVLLDVLVHDKKGRIIRDLKPEEIEVFEDGIKQPVSSFRFIDAEN